MFPSFFLPSNQHDSGNFPVDVKSESLFFLLCNCYLSPTSKRIVALVCLQLEQARHVSSRERKKSRKPMTPLTSKVKKFKMKAYSSYKDRFRTMNDGTIRRWREGKNHNAHMKSKKSRRRLRQPSTVPAAYAKVMKKLSVCV
ncbi:RIBOSOMAL PROTEIN L35 [Salix koriyanagi]|uniref:RIBOSOMAL PROTEIN L35 n=1 Tax=Salix koriyanagi TaxID=2511006 RepID=A0A9Q0T5N9_9ROSI|nr:RIBOSOMAL PROTEIN L35 [Salix koriyanagi]